MNKQENLINSGEIPMGYTVNWSRMPSTVICNYNKYASIMQGSSSQDSLFNTRNFAYDSGYIGSYALIVYDDIYDDVYDIYRWIFPKHDREFTINCINVERGIRIINAHKQRIMKILQFDEKMFGKLFIK